MKTSTSYKFLLFTLLPLCLSLTEARAQFPDPPVVTDAACIYDEPHLFLFYESIIDDVADPENFTVVINAVVPASNPEEITRLAFAAPGLAVVNRTVEELAADPFVELTVNREAFLATPDVIVTTFKRTNIFADIPFLPPVYVTWPNYIIDLQARIDTDDPCLEITPLPVELVAFDGKVTGKTVALTWQTASEQDNKQFEVEHSTDGQHFSQVGVVEGHGNSSTPISYQYTHLTPASGTNYYRLRQVDFSGAFEYSKVIAVNNSTAPGADLQVSVFPNPCQNGDCQVAVSNLSSSAPETVLELKDMSGKVVFRKAVRNEGKTSIALPLQELGAYRGFYILTATTGPHVVHERVVLE